MNEKEYNLRQELLELSETLLSKATEKFNKRKVVNITDINGKYAIITLANSERYAIFMDGNDLSMVHNLVNNVYSIVRKSANDK